MLALTQHVMTVISTFCLLHQSDGILPGCHSCGVCAHGACREGGETGVTCDCPPGRSGALCDQATAPNICQNSRYIQDRIYRMSIRVNVQEDVWMFCLYVNWLLIGTAHIKINKTFIRLTIPWTTLKNCSSTNIKCPTMILNNSINK